MENNSIARLDWERIIFAGRPRRSELSSIKPSDKDKTIKIRILRNTAVEYVAGPLVSFSAFAGFSPDLEFGAYDDTLSVSGDGPRDIDLVWLDWERYLARMTKDALIEWAADRLSDLRRAGPAPILVLGAEPPLDESFDKALAAAISGLPGARLVPRLPAARELGDSYFDRRLAGIGATTRSGESFVAIARELGLRWIPAALGPRLKAVAVDLDNTLYEGVLGEDGPTGLRLSPAHVELQRRLLELRDDGMLLALISRNEPEDVRALFGSRGDFPLRLEHFSAVEVGWGSKADALERAALAMRIGTDSILFVDDNLGELAAVGMAFPDTPLLHASDADRTAMGLRWFPGLHRWSDPSASDEVRARDLAANETRNRIARGSADKDDYLRSLQVKIGVAYRLEKDIPRVAELSGKTNQFNLSLRRIGEIELHSRKDDRSLSWVSVALSDRLSDSGIILSMVAEIKDDALRIEDLCISCRALGRGLETLMVTESINGLLEGTGLRRVAFRYSSGPRNGPARDWLAAFIERPLEPEGEAVVAWDIQGRRRAIDSIPVSIERRMN